MNYKLVFVGGCPRSGTTLVKRMLDAHPRIYCGPEFGHLSRIADFYRTMKKGIEIGRIDVYATQSTLMDNCRNFILSFFEPLIQKYNVEIFAEKTPDNVLEFITLHELFPEARLINVIRNPLDVVASYLRCGARMPNASQGLDSPFVSVSAATLAWKKRIKYLGRFPEIFMDPGFMANYKEVFYEDAVRDPESFARNLCEHIGIEYSADMLDTDRVLKGDAVKFGDVFYSKDEYQRGISNDRIGIWREVLDREQIITVLNLVGKEMVEYGYLSRQEIQKLRSQQSEPG